MEKFNGKCMVTIEYRRENGDWHLVRENVDARIRDRNPGTMARVTAIDLPLACSIKRKDSPEVRQRKKEMIPWKHYGLMVQAIARLGLYPQSVQEEISDETYCAMIVVESVSPPYVHLG